MKNVLAVIPARCGSKTIRDKNIRIMNGKPMLAYSIEQALQSAAITRVIVSTDSSVYKQIALVYGAEVPFLRPADIACDTSLDIDVFKHALQWLKDNEGYEADICVHLRPTHPIRDWHDIDKMVSILCENPEFDSVRSVSPAKQVPYKMWLFSNDGSCKMSPVAACDIPEAYNAPRQILPEVYMQNACIDVVRSNVIIEKNSMTGDMIAGYRMEYDFDIDTEKDFLRAERFQQIAGAVHSGKPLKVCCDIDGVLAEKTEGNDYNNAKPIKNNIQIINAMYQMGYHITLFTARGYKTGLDWKRMTEDQLDCWGIKYHELLFGKPDADIYIDDKLCELEELRGIVCSARKS